MNNLADTPLQRSSSRYLHAAGALSWLPDETCHSLAARYHVTAVNRLARESSLQLFGHPTAGTRHDFTGQLAEFSLRTDGELGDGRTIAVERTLLRYYLPFQTPEFSKAAIDTLQGPNMSKLKGQLGLLSSRFRAHHPLKACLDCMDEDVRRHGVAYWHLHHQCPGVWWCHRHRVPLAELSLKTNHVQRFLLHLPRRCNLVQWAPQANPVTKTVGLGLSRIAAGLMAMPAGTYFSRAHLADVYSQEVEARYGVDRVHASATKAVASGLLDVISQLADLPEFESVPSTIAGTTAVLRRLLQPRSNSHPIWHLLMAYWLFGDWLAFRRAIDAERSAQQQRSPPDTSVSNGCAGATKALALYASGKTVRAIALELDVDHKTAAAWLAKNGIATPRRAKLLKNDVRQRAINALRLGRHKDQVAIEAKVSVGSITQLLRSEPGLQAQWHVARHDARRHQARRGWAQALAKAGGRGTKAARSMAAADYAWLYRNDRTWLSGLRPMVNQAPRGRYAAQWAHRDEELCFDVLASILQIPADLPLRTRADALVRTTPRLQRYKGSLDKMPLTRDLVVAFTRKKTDRPKGQ